MNLAIDDYESFRDQGGVWDLLPNAPSVPFAVREFTAMKTAPHPVLISPFNFARFAGMLALFATSSLYAQNGPSGDQPGLSSDPYSVFVAYEEAHARCGPSTDYYRTDPLRHGQQLQVYVETDDGWLGVRPPEDSFCWVPASTIKTTQRGQAGTVIEDRTVAWIGTHLGRAKRYRWQVQLAKGEPVTIIGRSERDGPDGPQLWYRIVPPSGEFRWVHRDQVVQTAEQLVAMKPREVRPEPVEESIVVREIRAKAAARKNGSVALADRNAPRRAPESDTGRSVLSHGGQQAPAPRVAEVRPATDQSPQSSRRTHDRLYPVGQATIPVLSAAPSPQNVVGQSTASPEPGIRSKQAMEELGRALTNAAGMPVSQSTQSQSPVSRASVPSNQAAAEHLRQNQPHAAASESGQRSHDAVLQETVGSGLNQQWKQNPARPPAQATADFVSRPRLIEIGATGANAVPEGQTSANDANWIMSPPRNSMPNAVGQPPAGTNIALVGSQQQGYPQARVVNAGGMQVASADNNLISADALSRIQTEASVADVEKLHLMLSRLMASRAPAAAAVPIADAANRLAANSSEELTVARARLLSERVSQYQRIALRRDQTNMGGVIQANAIGATGVTAQPIPQSILTEPPTIPSNSTPSGTLNGDNASGQNGIQENGQQQPFGAQSQVDPRANGGSSAGLLGRQAPAPTLPIATGYLVQVYSARTNSPPYALTDNVGNTIAYVTPSPGVSLRHHINNHISVSGHKGYVHGLDTPHILVSQATRAQH